MYIYLFIQHLVNDSIEWFQSENLTAGCKITQYKVSVMHKDEKIKYWWLLNIYPVKILFLFIIVMKLDLRIGFIFNWYNIHICHTVIWTFYLTCKLHMLQIQVNYFNMFINTHLQDLAVCNYNWIHVCTHIPQHWR